MQNNLLNILGFDPFGFDPFNAINSGEVLDVTAVEHSPTSIPYTDPINGRTINVQSICRPKVSLLQGFVYRSGPTILQPKQYDNKV